MKNNLEKLSNVKIAVVGLGYVGLPLAVAFGCKYHTTGFDVKKKRIDELEKGIDRTRELDSQRLKSAKKLRVSCDSDSIKNADVYIVTVPTPIDSSKRPVLDPLVKASSTIGPYLSRGNLVIYESTVFPGCTEDVCVPILESESGLKFNHDFYCGYSPERINPGDKEHALADIKKVVSGSTAETAEFINSLYSSVINAGTHLAPSIKVAEAAKVIENAQRDLNIAFVNELALLFEKLGIDTLDVLDAAGTKWNFLPFRPGLVGGHCIGVDPYYLTHKAQEIGHHPEIILAGRRINDSMGKIIGGKVIRLMIKKKQVIADARILMIGITFKENCPDVRNTQVVDIINELRSYDCSVDVFDPLADPEEVWEEYGIELITNRDEVLATNYSACIVAVPHDDVFDGISLDEIVQDIEVVYDVKGVLDRTLVDGRL